LFSRAEHVDVESLVRPVVESAGLELVDVAFGRESGRRVLRVTIDREGEAVDLDTISATSDRISRRLDVEGFAPGPYVLEVSSPGIERPLRTARDFQRHVGAIVKLKTAAPTNGARVHRGALVSADDEAVVVAAAGGDVRVRYADIVSARTVFDWDAERKRSTT
jgi:ribosome maturation factor RimP